MVRRWCGLAAACAALVGLAGIALAQENYNKQEQQRSDQPRTEQQSDQQKTQHTYMHEHMMKGVSAHEAAEIARNVKQSLADSIKTAEKQTGGHAVSAMCLYGRDLGQERFRTGETGQKGQTGEMAENIGPDQLVCLVTVSVSDNKLVKVTIDANNGKVLAQHDINYAPLAFFEPGGQIGRTTMTDTDGMNMARRWQKASDLVGKTVKNSKDENLGKLENIVVDANSGRILYGVLSFGGVLGIGDKLFAIPWSSLEPTTDMDHIVLDVDKDRLKNAPGFDKSHWPDFADESFATSTHRYYGQTPYWQNQQSQQTSDVRAENYNERWNRRPTGWQKVTDLMSKDVRNPENEDLGTIKNLVIDPDNGRIMYGVLAARGKYYAIPWSALDLSTDSKKFVLNVRKDQLPDSASFSDNAWPNFTDQRWAADNYRAFGVEPYWRAPKAGYTD